MNRFQRNVATPCLPLLLLAGVTLSHAQSVPHTDAEKDGLTGPVKSVSTSALTEHSVHWLQPNGPTLLIPIWCSVCNYDPDGARTRQGDVMDGKLLGERISIGRNADGAIVSRMTFDATSDALLHEEKDGPFGAIDRTDYDHGALYSTHHFTYDAAGHQTSAANFDAAGNSIGRSETTYAADGTVLSDTTWDKNGQVSWRQTYDPATTEERFNTYDGAGLPKLAWKRLHDRVTSFWESSDEKQFGDGFIDRKDPSTVEDTACHANGACDHFLIHYVYLDPPHRNPASAEWRDTTGKLLYAVYYDYDFDEHRNWTRRTVYVLGPGQPERTLREEDQRTITYW